MNAYILYRSRSLVSRDLMVIGDILFEARRFNRAHGVSGCLYCCRAGFAQVIEGQREALCGAMRRIAQSRLHHAIEILDRGEWSARRFARWSMGAVSPDDSGPCIFEATPDALLARLEAEADSRALTRH